MGEAAPFGAAVAAVAQNPPAGAPLVFDMGQAIWEVATSGAFTVLQKGTYAGQVRFSAGEATVEFAPSRGGDFTEYSFGAPIQELTVYVPNQKLHLEGWISEANFLYYHADYKFYADKPYFHLDLAVVDKRGIPVPSGVVAVAGTHFADLVSDTSTWRVGALTEGSTTATGFVSNGYSGLRPGMEIWFPSFYYENGVDEKHDFYTTIDTIVGTTLTFTDPAPMTKNTGTNFFYHQNRRFRNLKFRLGAASGNAQVVKHYHPWYGVGDETDPYFLLHEVAHSGTSWGWKENYTNALNTFPADGVVQCLHFCGNGVDGRSILLDALHGLPRRDNRAEFHPNYTGAAVLTLRYAAGASSVTGSTPAVGATAEVLDVDDNVLHTETFSQVASGTTWGMNGGAAITLAATDKVVFRASGSGLLHIRGLEVNPTNADPTFNIDCVRLNGVLADGDFAVMTRHFWEKAPQSLVRTSSEIGYTGMEESGDYKILNSLCGGQGWSQEFMISMDADVSGTAEPYAKLYAPPDNHTFIVSNPLDYNESEVSQLDTEYDEMLEDWRDMFPNCRGATAMYGPVQFGDHAVQSGYHTMNLDLGTDSYNGQSGLGWTLLAAWKRLNDATLWDYACAHNRHIRDTDTSKYWAFGFKFNGVGSRKGDKLYQNAHAIGGQLFEYSYYAMVGLEMFRATGDTYWKTIWEQMVDAFGHAASKTETVTIVSDGTSTVTVTWASTVHTRLVTGQEIRLKSCTKAEHSGQVGYHAVTVVNDYTVRYDAGGNVTAATGTAQSSALDGARYQARTSGKVEATLDKVYRQARAQGYTGQGQYAPFDWDDIIDEHIRYNKGDALAIGRLYGTQVTWRGQKIQMLAGYHMDHPEDTVLRDLIIDGALDLMAGYRLRANCINTYDFQSSDGTPYSSTGYVTSSGGIGTPANAEAWFDMFVNGDQVLSPSISFSASGTTVTVTHTNHGWTQDEGPWYGRYVAFQAATAGTTPSIFQDGYIARRHIATTSANAVPPNAPVYSWQYAITIVDANTYTYQLATPLTATATGFANIGNEPTGMASGAGMAGTGMGSNTQARFYPLLNLSATAYAFSIGYRTANVNLTASGTTVTVEHTAHGLVNSGYSGYFGLWAFVEDPSHASFEEGRHEITIIDADHYSYQAAAPQPSGTAKINTDKTMLYNFFRWAWAYVRSGHAIRRVDTHDQEHLAWSMGIPYYFRDEYP